MAKEGSTIGGLMDSFGTATSIALQYGVPLEVLVNKFSTPDLNRLEHTHNPDIRIAKSVVDYIFRWLGLTFLPQESRSDYEYARKTIAADVEATVRRSPGKHNGKHTNGFSKKPW